MPRDVVRRLSVLVFGAVMVPLAAQQGGIGTTSPGPSMLVEEVILAADRLRADRWYPDESSSGEYHGGRLSRAADMDLLVLAARQPRPELRYMAIREFGRFETPANVGFLSAFLDDPHPQVKVAAADALVQSVFGRPEAASEAAMAVAAIEERLKREVLSPTRGELWMRLAELPMPASVATRYEREWLAEIQHLRDLRVPAAEALLRLAQTHADRTVEAATETAIQQWAEAGLAQGTEVVWVGTLERGSTLQFLRILQAMRTDNDRIAVEAAMFTCKTRPPCGGEIRDLGARLLNPHNPNHLFALERAARNRLDVTAASTAIRKLLQAPQASLCHLLEWADGLPAERDVVAALERRDPAQYEACLDWDPVIPLMADARVLGERSVGTSWVVPAEALETLARRFVATREEGERREVLQKFNADIAARHLRWEVRATAARVATLFDQIGLLTTLADDDHPNVRAQVITSLVRLESPLRWAVAIDALTISSDPHLIITAAESLRGGPQTAAVRDALMSALARLTDEAHDTSRRARVALIDRLVEVMPPGDADADVYVQPLRALITDFDPTVAAAAAEAVSRITGFPAYARASRRVAAQPDVGQIMTIPPCISFDVEGEVRPFTVVLDRLTAPIAVARLAELINSGYYNRTTLHYVDENVLRGGNRSANDEGGLPRFIRDEVGGRPSGPHLVLAAHDRDTADGRLMIRHRANLSRYRQETVVGRVVGSKPWPQGTMVTRAWIGAPEDLKRTVCPPVMGIPPILIPSGPAGTEPAPSE
jgi:cyclophilin family peptidyl-prolyl cis-trans isomerase